MNKRFLELLREIFGDKLQMVDTQAQEYPKPAPRTTAGETDFAKLPIIRGPYVPKKTEPSEHMRKRHKGGKKVKIGDSELDVEYMDYHPDEDKAEKELLTLFRGKGKK